MLSTSQWLKQQYLDHDSWQQWREIPNLMQFDQRLGELKGGASEMLKEMDYSTCYYNMIEDSSVITTVSVKSLVNEITHLAAGCILIKGAPDQGKSFLLAKLLQYWALGYGMRNSILVFWVDCSQIRKGCNTLEELLLQLLPLETPIVKSVCSWIEDQEGKNIVFVLDAYDYQERGNVVEELTSGELLPELVVLIASTCTPFSFSVDWSYFALKQFELLTLSDTQIFKQVIQFLNNNPRAEDFFQFLTINPDMRLLASNPVNLYTLLFACINISCESLVTWTELFTNVTFLFLRSTFPEVQAKEQNRLDNLPRNVESFLLDFSALAFENLTSDHSHQLSLTQQMVSLLGHKSGFALVHHYSTPLFCKGKQYFQFFSKLLQQFLAAVHVARLPLSEQTELMAQKKGLSFLWQFYAGLITSEPFERFEVLKERYCKGITKALTNCAYEANWVCDIPSNIEDHILTAADIHHLKIASNMNFDECCFGKAALYQLGKQAHAHALNGDQQIEMG